MFETIIENLLKLPPDTIQTYLSDSHLLFLLEESLKISLPSSFLDIKIQNEEGVRRSEGKEVMMEEGGVRREGGEVKEEVGGSREEGFIGQKGAGFIVLTKDKTLNNCFDLIKSRIVRVLRKIISLEGFKDWSWRRQEFDEFLKKLLGFIVDEVERYVAFENCNMKMMEIEVS